MKKFIYFLAALMALTVTSCKDDDTTFNVTEDLDRLPMPMFRRKVNTNIDDLNDLYASRLVDGYANRIQLHWYGVDGAAGYEVRYGKSGNARDTDEFWDGENVTKVILPPDQLSMELKDLEYNGTNYIFSIRALHPDGQEAHHSRWYGRGDGSHGQDYLIIPTGKRYATPKILQIDQQLTGLDEFTIMVNPTWNRASQKNSQDADTIESRFNIVNGKFQFTHIVVEPKSLGAKVPEEYLKGHLLSPAELTPDADGYIRIRVTGLDQSALYSVTLRDDSNPKATADADRIYLLEPVRTKGVPGKPILLTHKVATSIWVDPNATAAPDMDLEQQWLEAEQKYNACRIDTVFSNFNNNFNLGEGQVYLLEGGKAYYIRSNTDLCKGFVLKTDPKDLAEKGRATVYLGGLFRNQAGACVSAANWVLGRNAMDGEYVSPILLESVVFEDIDFICPNPVNYGENAVTKAGATGNYFVNMYSGGLPVTFESFEMRNCTFQGIQRGFFRIQGNNCSVINHIVMDNNVLFNCGFYSAKGIDYNIFHGEAKHEAENMCGDLKMTNNTFYDCPMGTISPTKNGVNSKDFEDDIHWNVMVENNTFINHCTRSDQAFLNMRHVPGDSKIGFKNNLIVLTRDANDQRRLAFCGAYIETIHGSQKIEFDICNNWSASSEEAYRKDDGIVTKAANKFSVNKNAPGAWPDCLGANSAEDLVIKVGSTP
ncbi:MAG: fibronectin type III domain-containing protein, partial [Duncaniella sp.]|nr:fibronectin type III domain-containing protein [Duncaniella sp.]